MSPEQFQQKILSWFDLHGRKDLPWQKDINLYRVWISEIMLQQTQVATVIPYFLRFTSSFPDVASLAKAELDDVLQHWSGLGYYARARNIHKTAVIIHNNNDWFPDTLEGLIDLPGIGRSTAGAMLSIACQQSHPILDGNVKRVLTRFHGISGWSGSARISTELWAISSRFTPQSRTADFTQAMMDMGSTLCTRSKPSCTDCPVNSACYAYREGKINELPTQKPRQKIPVKHLFLLILKNEQKQIYLEKRAPVGIWGGLWSLPEFDDFESLECWCRGKNYRLINTLRLPARRHTFSHFHLDYTPVIVQTENPENFVMEANQAVWYKSSQQNSLGLPAPIKRLLQEQDTEEIHG